MPGSGLGFGVWRPAFIIWALYSILAICHGQNNILPVIDVAHKAGGREANEWSGWAIKLFEHIGSLHDHDSHTLKKVS